jgi:TetR/AcrR family transcriptional regulator, transcriptional repressor for nem operon
MLLDIYQKRVIAVKRNLFAGDKEDLAMRMSREATAQTKARILAAAAKMVRERGIGATSVADVMQAAGMTNGGFYRHFRSKDEMIAMAIRAAFDEIADRFDRRRDVDGAEAAIGAYIGQYLSEGHIEHPGVGCPVAAIGADAGRCDGAFAEEFIAGAERLIAQLCAGSAATAKERAKAIRLMTMLAGAVVLARAAGPGALRNEIIEACNEELNRVT